MSSLTKNLSLRSPIPKLALLITQNPQQAAAIELEQAKAREIATRADNKRLKGEIAAAREKMKKLKAEAREAHLIVKEATIRRGEKDHYARLREETLSQKLNEVHEEVEKLKAEIHEVRSEADEANARRRTASEQARTCEAELSQKLNEARERDAKASMEIARLNVEKAMLQHELIQQGSGGDVVRACEKAAKVEEREVLDVLGWTFKRG